MLDFYDLAVIGGGSAGFGAALAAARRGLSVIVIEPAPALGGNSTLGGVNTWEPAIGGPGFHAELFALLRAEPKAIGVSKTAKTWTGSEPWSLSKIIAGGEYRSTLRRSGLSEPELARVTFEPRAMSAAMEKLLKQTGRVELCYNSRFSEIFTDDRRIRAITIQSATGERTRVEARHFVDCTAQLIVALAAGCASYLGSEPRSTYDEPSAPPAHLDRINGVSLCFRVTPAERPQVEPLPPGTPQEHYPCSYSLTEYPCGDLNINPLPLMEGMEFHKLGPSAGRKLCEQRVYQTWRWLQAEKGFDRFRIAEVFPLTGVREGPRLIGRRVLTENDVRRESPAQAERERWITLADHALDVHGEGHMCRELRTPYGVPFDCLLPKEFDNLAIAGRAASFSHIAGSSCRLTRTMMQLGHAAGIASAVARDSGVGLPEVDAGRVRAMLAEDNVALSAEDARFPQPAASVSRLH